MPRSPRTVLITGCSSGIGRALALELHARGHRVFASARRPESIADLPCEKVTLDVTEPDQLDRAVRHVIGSAGGIDVLINNAGIHAVGPLVELPLEDLRRLFETNVVGLTAVTQAVFPHMAERRAGRIVNIGSIVHMFATPFGGAYAASKAAVHLLSDAMRMELAPFGIDVVEVQPGGVQSSLADTAEKGLEPFRAPSSRYRAAFDGILARARASQQNPLPTDVFARGVADAVLSPSPPRILRLGTGARGIPWLKRLPAGLLERGLRKRFGLDGL